MPYMANNYVYRQETWLSCSLIFNLVSEAQLYTRIISSNYSQIWFDQTFTTTSVQLVTRYTT